MKRVVCPACGLSSEVRDLPDDKWMLCLCGEKVHVPGSRVKPARALSIRPKTPWYATEVPFSYIVLGLPALGGALFVAYRLHVEAVRRAEEIRRLSPP